MDLRRIPPELLAVALAAALLLALVQSFRLAWRTFSRRRRLEMRRERGAAGEVWAESLLERRGYTILGRQVAVSYDLRVDGERVAVSLRADYLVSLDRRRFVAEVKTGRVAPRIDTSATRRQLLEYRLAFDVDGVLLVDAESAQIHAVDFPLPELLAAHPSGGRLGWLLAGISLGLVGAFAARLFG